MSCKIIAIYAMRAIEPQEHVAARRSEVPAEPDVINAAFQIAKPNPVPPQASAPVAGDGWIASARSTPAHKPSPASCRSYMMTLAIANMMHGAGCMLF